MRKTAKFAAAISYRKLPTFFSPFTNNTLRPFIHLKAFSLVSLPLNCLWGCTQPLASPPWGPRSFSVGRWPGALRVPGRCKIPPAQGPASLDTSLGCVLAVVGERGWRVSAASRTADEVPVNLPAAKTGWYSASPGRMGPLARGDVVDRS